MSFFTYYIGAPSNQLLLYTITGFDKFLAFQQLREIVFLWPHNFEFLAGELEPTLAPPPPLKGAHG